MPPALLIGAHESRIAGGELRLPPVDEAASVPSVHDLALVLSGRVDDYSDVGHTIEIFGTCADCRK